MMKFTVGDNEIRQASFTVQMDCGRYIICANDDAPHEDRFRVPLNNSSGTNNYEGMDLLKCDYC
jgi:hypothetical protein